jgi:hypothetical protein
MPNLAYRHRIEEIIKFRLIFVKVYLGQDVSRFLQLQQKVHALGHFGGARVVAAQLCLELDLQFGHDGVTVTLNAAE